MLRDASNASNTMMKESCLKINFNIAHNKRDYIELLHISSVEGALIYRIFYSALQRFGPFDKIHIFINHFYCMVL
jgi:hypothetical protein